jgi:hypothetical protein
MATKTTKSRPALRKNVLRIDCSVKNAEKIIRTTFGLPKGCVRLVNPSGRKARGDKLVHALLRDWGH